MLHQKTKEEAENLLQRASKISQEINNALINRDVFVDIIAYEKKIKTLSERVLDFMLTSDPDFEESAIKEYECGVVADLVYPVENLERILKKFLKKNTFAPTEKSKSHRPTIYLEEKSQSLRYPHISKSFSLTKKQILLIKIISSTPTTGSDLLKQMGMDAYNDSSALIVAIRAINKKVADAFGLKDFISSWNNTPKYRINVSYRVKSES